MSAVLLYERDVLNCPENAEMVINIYLKTLTTDGDKRDGSRFVNIYKG